MNSERLQMLADHIRESDTYDQRFYYHQGSRLTGIECGSPGCIAGHADALFGSGQRTTVGIHARARILLGLTTDEGHFLFDEDCLGWPDDHLPKGLNPTNLEAADLLDALASGTVRLVTHGPWGGEPA